MNFFFSTDYFLWCLMFLNMEQTPFLNSTTWHLSILQLNVLNLWFIIDSSYCTNHARLAIWTSQHYIITHYYTKCRLQNCSEYRQYLPFVQEFGTFSLWNKFLFCLFAQKTTVLTSVCLSEMDSKYGHDNCQKIT